MAPAAEFVVMSTAGFNHYPAYPLALAQSPRPQLVAAQMGYLIGGDLDTCFYRYKIEDVPEPPGLAIETAYAETAVGGYMEICTFFEGAASARVTITLPDGRELVRETTPAAYEGTRFGQLTFVLAPGDPLGEYQVSLTTGAGTVETTFLAVDATMPNVRVLNLAPGPVPFLLPPGETELILGVVGYPGENSRSVHIYATSQSPADGADYLNSIVVPLDARGNGGAVIPVTEEQAGKSFILWSGGPEQLYDPMTGDGPFPVVSSIAESAVVVIPTA